MTQARVGHPDHKTFCSFLSPDPLVLDNLGLHRLDEQHSIDLCELAFAVAAVLGLVPDSHQPDEIRLAGRAGADSDSASDCLVRARVIEGSRGAAGGCREVTALPRGGAPAHTITP